MEPYYSCYLRNSSWGPNHNVALVIHIVENAVDMYNVCIHIYFFNVM